MPVQRMRAFFSEGKAPKPEVETLNGSWPSLSGWRAFFMVSRSSSATSPRNFRVRWILSWPTRRKSLLVGRFWAARNNASRTSCGGKMATKVLIMGSIGAGIPAVAVRRATEGCAVGDKGCCGARADPVIHVDDGEAGGAGLEHPEDGRCTVAAEAVPGGGRQSYYRHGDQAGDHA